MFALPMTGVKYVESYEMARAMYEKAPKQVSSGSGDRKIPGKDSKITGMSLIDDVVGFIYHATYVVKWYPDGTVVLDLSYKSRSTATFANRLCGDKVEVMGEAELYYATDRFITIRPDGVIDGAMTVAREVVDPEKAKVAMVESGYNDFAAWYKDAAALIGPAAHSARDYFEVIGYLKDRDSWHRILMSNRYNNKPKWDHDGKPTPEAFLRKLRADIHKKYDCFRTVTETSATSYTQMRKWLRE